MTKKLLRFFPYLILLLLMFGLGVSGGVADAPASNPPQEDVIKPGIDLIVLLDQSGSMRGVFGTPATDPENRRIYTTQYLIDYMAFDNKYVNQQRTNRVAVIGFGSRAVVQVPLTEVKDDNAVETAKGLVTPLNLDGTNFVTALEAVRQMFSVEDDQAEVASGLRQRMIVIITDGGPDTGEPIGFGEHFDRIRAAYFDPLSLPDKHYDLDAYYPLYVITIDDSDQYWPWVGPEWQAFAARAEQVDDVNQVNRLVADILCSSLNPDGSNTSSCRLQQLGAHFIQPYGRIASFSFFKYTANERIILQRPDGTTVDLDTPDEDVLDHAVTDRDEMIIMSNPQPGCWFSSAGNQGEGQVDVITQVVFNDLRLVQPTSAHPRAVPLNLVFELRNEAGEMVDEDPNFPITIEAVLTGPDGTEQPIIIQSAIDENGRSILGRYVSRNIPDLPMKGNYVLVVRGTTSPSNLQSVACLNSAEPIRVFENLYEIPVIDAGFQVIGPDQPFLQYSPVENLTISYLDDDEEQIQVEGEYPWLIELTALSPSGASISLPSPELENGFFVIQESLVFAESGEYRLTAVLRNPESNLVLDTVYTSFSTDVNPMLVLPAENYPAFALLEEVFIQMADPDGNLVAPSESYTLRVEGDLVWPDGEIRAETVKFVETDQPGVYSSPVHWTLTDPGSYSLNLRGYISITSVDERPAFEYPLTLNISSNIPYFKVITPDTERVEGQNIYSLHYGLLPFRKPMPLRVEIWRGNALVTPGEVFTTAPGELVHVTVVGPDSQEVVIDQTLPLAEDGKALELLADQLTAPGTYTATFTFQGDLIGGADTKGLWQEVEVTFIRQDATWVKVIWGILIGLAVLGVLALIGLFLWQFMFGTKAVGTLVAEHPGVSSTPIKEFPVGRKRRHTVVIGRNELGELRLKQIKVTGTKIIYEDGTKKSGKIKQAEVNIEATNPEGKVVARGKLTAQAQRQTSIPCQQKDTDEKNYQFKLKI